MKKILTEKDAEDFLERHKFPVVKRAVVKNEKQLIESSKKIGFPIVLKNPFILHKTEKSAVITDINQDNLLRSYSLLKKRTKSKTLLMQKQLSGLELILGLKKDPVFGHVILCGAGGIFTELLRDTSSRICPIAREDAKSMLSELKISKLFNFRNKNLNQNALLSLLIWLSELTKRHPNIQELDLNPVILDEKSATIVDARIAFGAK